MKFGSGIGFGEKGAKIYPDRVGCNFGFFRVLMLKLTILTNFIEIWYEHNL